MKKILICILLFLSIVFGSSCNCAVVDLNYQYNYAYITIGDKVFEYEISAWTDVDSAVGEYTLKLSNGNVIMVDSKNCTLTKNRIEEFKGE